MKGKNKLKLFKRILSLLLICVLMLDNSFLANAISKDAKAKKAYAEVLNDIKIAEGIISTGWGLGTDTKFALVDINNDGINEMVFTPDDGYHIDIVAYVNGKVKNIGSGFSGTQLFYPNKKIYYSDTWHASRNEGYYKFNGKKMISLASIYGAVMDDESSYVYHIGKKEVTKKSYQKYVKKLKKGAKEEKIKYFKNTSANRKKHLN